MQLRRNSGRALAAALVLLAMLLSPLSSPAASDRSDTSPSPEALDDLFRQMMEQPADLDLMFAYAQTAVQLGKLEAAITTYERMLLFDPDLPRVRLELASLYYALGSFEAARLQLEAVKAAPDLPPQVRERVEALDARISEAGPGSRLFVSAFSGLRYQSNANSGPGSPNVKALGFDAVLADQFTAQSDWNAFLSGAATYLQDLDSPFGENWETRALLYASRQHQLRQLDVGVVEVETGPHLAVLPDRLTGLTLRPYLSTQYVNLNRETLFYSYGGGLDIARAFDGHVLAVLGQTVRKKRFRDTSRLPTASDRTGEEYQTRLDVTWRIDQAWSVRGQLSFLRDVARFGFESSRDLKGIAGVDYDYATPFNLSPIRSRVSASAGYGRVRYDAPDITVDPWVRRTDDELRLMLGHSLRIGRSMSLETQVQRTEVSANLPNYQRDNWSVMVGIGAVW